MDKSAITMTTGCDWWLERVTMGAMQLWASGKLDLVEVDDSE